MIVIINVVIAYLVICSAVVFIECCASLWFRDAGNTTGTPPSVGVIVPAHNEEAGIDKTLDCVMRQLTSRDRAVVIADNCSDSTAQRAATYTPHVVERNNTADIGKGYALAAGVRYLSADPPDIVVFIDADCLTSDKCISTLAALADKLQCPVQGAYVMSSAEREDGSCVDPISTFAIITKNLTRLAGCTVLGIPCPITGSGMALPWALASSLDLASGALVEDMKMSLELACAGHYTHFCEKAVITSQLPESLSARLRQRRRWEHGHLHTILKTVPVLLASGCRQGRPTLILAALDLAVPPLSLLVLMWTACFALSCALALRYGRFQEVTLLLLTAALLTSAAYLSWWKYGHQLLSLRAVGRIPGYLVQKVAIYRDFVYRRETSWVRTDRPTDTKPVSRQASHVVKRDKDR